MRVRGCILFAVLVVGWTAAPAHAQLEATPYIGANILGDVERGKGGPGGSVGYYFLDGRLGFEFEFQRYFHFFKDAEVADLVPNPGIDLDTDAMSFMGNVVAPIRIPGAARLRPYGVAGFGLFHAWFDSADDQYDTDQNNLAFALGGGLMVSLTDFVGLRADLRALHALVDGDATEGGYFEDYTFLRLSLGVTFRFPW